MTFDGGCSFTPNVLNCLFQSVKLLWSFIQIFVLNATSCILGYCGKLEQSNDSITHCYKKSPHGDRAVCQHSFACAGQNELYVPFSLVRQGFCSEMLDRNRTGMLHVGKFSIRSEFFLECYKLQKMVQMEVNYLVNWYKSQTCLKVCNGSHQNFQLIKLALFFNCHLI